MDIASISAIVAAGSVLVGVAFAYLEVRSLVRTRQTDLVIRLIPRSPARNGKKPTRKC